MRTSSLTCLTCIAAVVMYAQPSHADITLTVEGLPGSSVFTMTASGSFTNAGTEATFNNSGTFLRLTRAAGAGWVAPTTPNWSGSSFGVLPANAFESGTSGVLTFDITGDFTQTHTFGDIFRGNGVWMPVDQTNTLDWPVINAGQNITITASGSVTFNSDITFDDLVPGTYTYGLPLTDGLSYVVQQGQAQPIPTPTALPAGVAALGVLAMRRRR